MSEQDPPTQPADDPSSRISKILGATQLLPGESAEIYLKGLQSTLQELGARTPLQEYIAEKIFQCLWWMRRYEAHKRSTIIEGMVDALTDYDTSNEKRRAIRTLLHAGSWGEDALEKLLKSNGHTQASLLELAIRRSQDEIQQLDQLIALRVKTLTQLQQSYEALVNRSVMQERLKLQNDLIKRDLQAIDIRAVEAALPGDGKSRGAKDDGKPQTESRQ
jgi:hypothetical protein